MEAARSSLAGAIPVTPTVGKKKGGGDLVPPGVEKREGGLPWR